MDRFFPSQHSSEPWFRVHNLDITTTILVVATGVLSMFVYAINLAWLEPFVFGSEQVKDGQIWRLLTWPLVNLPSIWTVLTLAIFYLFGREIERMLGRARFLWFLLFLTLIPALVGTLVGLTGNYGLNMLTTAVFLIFVLMYPTAKSWFEIPLWVFGVVFIGIEVLQLLGARQFSDQSMQVLAFFAAILITATLLARGYELIEYSQIPKLPLPLGVRGGSSTPKQPRASRRSRKQRGPAEVIPIRSNQPTAADLLRQAEVDVLLDKISEHGLSSLTPEERRRLDDHSRRLRDER